MRIERIIAALLLLPGLAAAQGDGYQIETVAEGLEHPWSIAFLPDGGLLVTERAGRLRLIRDGRLRAEPVAGLPPVHTGRQAGLFEVALAPDFADSRRLYLSYACGTGSANNTCLARARFDGDGLTEVEVIFEAQPKKRGNAHYGGRIAFLPDDTLVLTLGDGFDYREQAQDPSNHLGALVRLNLDGSVPDDNPFVGRDGHAPEILSFGHRNSQGIVYDAANDRLLQHEHGPRGGDELNLIEPGRNYGWPVVTFGIDYSGARISPHTTLPGYTAPLYQWTPSIAPSGMTVYDGDRFPEWRGHLLVSALAVDRGVHRVQLAGGQAVDEELLFEELDARIRAVRTGPDGAVYLLTDAKQGRVLRVVPARRR